MVSKKKRGLRADKTGRSIGSHPHVRLYRWMTDSAAWRDLTLKARALLPELYALYNGMNNGELFMSVRYAAAKLGVSNNTALKALDELEKHGFTKANTRGSFTCKSHEATTWVLTEFDYAGETATKDFMRWSPKVKGN